MALHPRARRLLLVRELGEDSGPDSLANHFDGVLGDGFSPAQRPGRDLRDGLAPPTAPGSGTSWPGTERERRFVGFLHQAGVRPNRSLGARLVEQARAASRTPATAPDLVVLGLIPWRYRYQRPQHLSVGLARRAWRVLYIDPDFLPESDGRAFAVEEAPVENVFRVQLRMPGPSDIHASSPDPRQVAALREALQRLAGAVGLRDPIVLLEAPFWLPAIEVLERSLLAYDCMDFYRAFPHVKEPLVALEDELLACAETVVFSSAVLEQQLGKAGRTVVVRNACEFERFSSATPRRLSRRPTVGYVGAVDRWFDADLLIRCVDAHPEWDFVLVGSAAGLPADALPARANLHLTGEVAYEDVPALVRGFDVCLIPFVDSPLTRCVDPVKVYEYLAAGRPVVATALPELQRLDPGLVHVARTTPEFLESLDTAMAETGDPSLTRRRRAWASHQTWDARAEELDRALSQPDAG
jgi:glycosyltransferase involved in cell wall biosynthesis